MFRQTNEPASTKSCASMMRNGAAAGGAGERHLCPEGQLAMQVWCLLCTLQCCIVLCFSCCCLLTESSLVKIASASWEIRMSSHLLQTQLAWGILKLPSLLHSSSTYMNIFSPFEKKGLPLSTLNAKADLDIFWVPPVFKSLRCHILLSVCLSHVHTALTSEVSMRGMCQ